MPRRPPRRSRWRWHWLRRSLTVLLGLPVTLLLGIAAVLWWSVPRIGDASIPGLSAPVSVTLDADGVPRIRARTEQDAAAALGWLHARDRMFQMDLMRRGASGRLSEIAGASTLRIDRLTRTLGLERAAEASLSALSPETRAILDAYARGVNAWIGARRRLAAPEFLLLGPPEPWRPVDSLLWGKVMGLALGGNYRTELGRLRLSAALPPERLRELWPEDRQAGRPEASLLPFPNPAAPFAAASNIWAVDGRHSATGAPLLASDPHLGYAFPPAFYLARIEVAGHVVAGATAPGVPLVLIGHNGRIAWGFTTTQADSEDLFIERLTPDGGYETPDGPRPFVTREEVIQVRGADPVHLTVRETRHGPVISDIESLPLSPGTVVAAAIAALAPGDTAAEGLLDLTRAGDVAAAGIAAAKITVPVQNLVVADRERIALLVTGRIPIRRAGDGAMPAPGHDGSHDWLGFATGNALPRIVAPASGRIVNANERVAPPDFPVFLGRDWFGDWRARRIRQMLDTKERHELADFAAMQMDVQSLLAADLLPAMTAIPDPGGTAGEALALLRGWTGAMTPEAPQPLIFNAWLGNFVAAVLRRAGVADGVGETTGEFARFVLGDGGGTWCGGDCGPLLSASLTATVGQLAARLGGEPRLWRWDRLHVATFAHPILRFVPGLGRLIGARVPVGGDFSTVNRQGFRGGDFTAIHGASFRAVFDLSDLDRSTFVIGPGQSGHPLSAHASDFAERWRTNTMVTLGPETPGGTEFTLNPRD